MEERAKFALVATILMTMTGLSWLLPLRNIVEHHSTNEILATAVLPLIITAFSFLYIRHEYRNARAGFPIADERSKMIRLYAGYYAFFVYAAFTLVLFVVVLSGARFVFGGEVLLEEVFFAMMTALVVVFLGLWALFTWKGRAE
ncbi:MAG: hypothetical protein A3K67_03800 [Euryarchaeota archaeon RBG_16_62_10]|nr:MAG: hypothetical protein A3K67_03800 [Euryarchaeota archaeon RBG_16_62_10]